MTFHRLVRELGDPAENTRIAHAMVVLMREDKDDEAYAYMMARPNANWMGITFCVAGILAAIPSQQVNEAVALRMLRIVDKFKEVK